MEPNNFPDELSTFDCFENFDNDYEFNYLEQDIDDTFLQTYEVNEEDGIENDIKESAENGCEFMSSSHSFSENDANEINVDNCGVFHGVNSDSGPVIPSAELNCFSTTTPLPMTSDDSENAELASMNTYIETENTISRNHENRKSVDRINTSGRQQLVIKVIRRSRSDSTNETTSPPDSSNYEKHTDVAIETDIKRSKKVGDEESDSSMDRCLNRNAVQARINRAKKKAYIAKLEEEVDVLSREKEEMKRKIDTFEEKEADLIAELQYLKSVLANESMLSHLISNINGVNAAELNAPLITNQKRKADTTELFSTSKRFKSPTSPEGICLHVCENRLSLELCHHCANSSKSSIAGNNNRYNCNFVANAWWLQFLLQLSSLKYAVKKEE